MAELRYATSVSLDGYIADEHGNFDWAAPSEEVHRFFNDLQRSVGTFRAMKTAAGRDLSIGGAGLAGEAIRAGLIDRYQLRIVPAIVGGGTRALPDAAKVDLALHAERRFADGTVLLDYRAR